MSISICIILCLAVISTAGEINKGKTGLSDNDRKKMIIELKDDLIINAGIDNIPLGDVLKEIEKKSGIKINFFDKPVLERKIKINLKNRDLESFLKSVLGENYVFIFRKIPNQKKYILTEVRVANKSLKPSNRVITKEFLYGSGKNNIGSVRAGEGVNMGPGSFTTDAKGNIYICDTVNRRIQIISPDGSISSIPLKDQMPEDISIDSNGFIYVYDAEGILYCYDNTGNSISEIRIDEIRWDSRGPMHIINNEIYVRGSGRGDVLVAKIENGKLVFPSDEELKKPLEEGIYGSNGCRYKAFLTEEMKGGIIERGGGIEVVEKDGTASTRFIPLEGIVSVEFVGEDRNGNSYVKTEGDKNGELVVEVSIFDATGSYKSTIPIPGKEYDFWAIKTVSVDEDGSIYQMMPGKDKVTINVFHTN